MDAKKDSTPRGKLLRSLTALAEPFYAAVVALRNKAYDTGLLKTHRIDIPVISVGNLTTGGTGKTPMVIHIAQLLQKNGRRPAVILRGYKSAAGQSDEANLLREALPGVPVITNSDRVAAAGKLRIDHPAVDVIILDDAFQHRRIHRDVDLVLIDATNPFGHGHILPRGLLRERPAGLLRATAVVVTHAERLADSQRAMLEQHIRVNHRRSPIAWFSHVWSHLLDEHNQNVTAAGALVLPFCGIGNPDAYFAQAGKDMRVANPQPFPDHHAYTAADLQQLADRAVATGAAALLTTEKDWVKLRPLVESATLKLPIWRPILRVQCTRDEKSFEHLFADL